MIGPAEGDARPWRKLQRLDDPHCEGLTERALCRSQKTSPTPVAFALRLDPVRVRRPIKVLTNMGLLVCGLMKVTNLVDIVRSFLGMGQVHDARRRVSTQPIVSVLNPGAAHPSPSRLPPQVRLMGTSGPPQGLVSGASQGRGSCGKGVCLTTAAPKALAGGSAQQSETTNKAGAGGVQPLRSAAPSALSGPPHTPSWAAPGERSGCALGPLQERLMCASGSVRRT